MWVTASGTIIRINFSAQHKPETTLTAPGKWESNFACFVVSACCEPISQNLWTVCGGGFQAWP